MATMETTPSPVTAEPQRFGPSFRALQQRQWLLQGVKALALACLGAVLLIFQPPAWWAELLKWAVALGLGWTVWRLPGEALLAPIRQRSLVLHEQALELNRGGFRRFIVFENLKHVRLLQGRGERLIAIELHTADDSVLLRDLDGLGEVFAALSARKPASVLIEVESAPVDWGEPLPWALALASAALVLALAVWFSGLQKPEYAALVGRGLLVDGGLLALWRPAAKGLPWLHHLPEALLGCCFIFFGRVFLA